MAKTAAILIIGNEVLTGKVEEANVAYLAKELFALGIELRRVIVCPDIVETIAADVNALRAAHDVVFTTGGVGPTHDDVTIEGIALGFGVPVVASEDMLALLRGHYRERATAGHLRMADIPQGAELIHSAEIAWPTVAMQNVIILPGVPELVKLKFPVLRARLATGTSFSNETVYTLCDEGEIAALLHEIVARHPNVTVGSYVKWRSSDYTTKITFDALSRDDAERAANDLRSALAPEKLVDVRE